MALQGKGQGYPQAHWCIGAALTLPNPGVKPVSPFTQLRQSSSPESQPHHGTQQPALRWDVLRGDPACCCSLLLYPCRFQPSRMVFISPPQKQECCEVLLGAHKPAVIRYRASCALVAMERPCCPCWSWSCGFLGSDGGISDEFPPPKGGLGSIFQRLLANLSSQRALTHQETQGHGKLFCMLRNASHAELFCCIILSAVSALSPQLWTISWGKSSR